MMPNDSFSPKDIVDKKYQFRIPLYQRPYAWEGTQVEQLLTDLYKAYKDNEKQDYHLGILSVSSILNKNKCFDLIDGQQRITTIILFGLAVKNNSEAVKNNSEAWKGFIENRLELYGRPDDQNFINGNSDSECNDKMKKAVATIDTFIKDKIKDKTNFSDFIEFVYNRAKFFISEMPSTYTLLDKNQQFVRMNNRGKQLEKHEILKIQLLSKLDNGKQADHFNYWNMMVKCLTVGAESETNKGSEKSEVDVSYSTTLNELLSETDVKKDNEAKESLYYAIVTIPDFLLIALYRFIQLERNGLSISELERNGLSISELERNGLSISEFSFDKDKFLETFSVLTTLPKGCELILDFSNYLNSQLDMLKKYFIFRNKDDGRSRLGYKLELEKDKVDGEAEDRRWLTVLQSYLFVSTEPHHWMPRAFDYLSEKNYSHNEFIDRLESIDNDLITSKDSLRNISVNDLTGKDKMTYHSVNRYWFYRLDYELWKMWSNNKDKDKEKLIEIPKFPELQNVQSLITQFKFVNRGSIEHIYPQTPESHDSKWKDNSDVACSSGCGIDGFGNLALITASSNSSYNNQSFNKKREDFFNKMKNRKSIESLKLLDVFSNIEWNSKVSKEHGCKMLEILRNSIPKSPDAEVSTNNSDR